MNGKKRGGIQESGASSPMKKLFYSSGEHSDLLRRSLAFKPYADAQRPEYPNVPQDFNYPTTQPFVVPPGLPMPNLSYQAPPSSSFVYPQQSMTAGYPYAQVPYQVKHPMIPLHHLDPTQYQQGFSYPKMFQPQQFHVSSPPAFPYSQLDPNLLVHTNQMMINAAAAAAAAAGVVASNDYKGSQEEEEEEADDDSDGKEVEETKPQRTTKERRRDKRDKKSDSKNQTEDNNSDGTESEKSEKIKGENRLVIKFTSYGTPGKIPQHYGRGNCIIPDGLSGTHNAYHQPWKFQVTHVKNGDVVCIRWTLTNMNTKKVFEATETPEDAHRRGTRGWTITNRLFREALEDSAQELEKLLETVTNPIRIANIKSLAKKLRPKQFSEGPLIFGLQHAQIQARMAEQTKLLEESNGNGVQEEESKAANEEEGASTKTETIPESLTEAKIETPVEEKKANCVEGSTEPES